MLKLIDILSSYQKLFVFVYFNLCLNLLYYCIIVKKIKAMKFLLNKFTQDGLKFHQEEWSNINIK